MVAKLEERPPFIAFETVSVEDREASIKAGHYVGKDVDMAYITPAGSKDRIERVVADWMPQLAADLAAERIPPAWVKYYKESYAAYREGQEAPSRGTPIKDWPGISPTQLKTFQSLRLTAIEDVAQANEETIARLGMGGRSLKQRAIDYLAAANDIGKTAEELSSTKSRLAAESERADRLEAQVQELAARLNAALPPAGQVAETPTAGSTITAEDLGLTKL